MSEGANEESIRLVLNDASRVWLRTADERYAREYNGPRMRFKEGPLDVQAVLEKNKSGSSVISWQSRADQVQRGRTEVWYALGAEDNVVIRLKAVCNEIWDPVANCGALATLPDTHVRRTGKRTNTRAESFQETMVATFDVVAVLIDDMVV